MIPASRTATHRDPIEQPGACDESYTEQQPSHAAHVTVWSSQPAASAVGPIVDGLVGDKAPF
jgi:hypothetical protein